VIDVVDLGAGLLGWGDPNVAAAREIVKSADSLVVASPTRHVGASRITPVG
jgi:FMN reductase